MGAALAAALAIAAFSPHPTAKLVSASKSGGSVTFTVRVTIAASPCTGMATLSAAGHHWKAPATLSQATCHATIHGKLPKKEYGKSLAFHFAIAGRSGSKTLKLKSGPLGVPVPSYVNGGWHGNLSSPMSGYVMFTVIDGVIQKAFSTSSGFVLDCKDPNDQPVKTFFIVFIKPAMPLQANGSFTRTYHSKIDPNTSSNGSGEDMIMTASGTLGNGTGTMTVTASGSLYSGHANGQTQYDESDCHGTNTFPVYKSS